ncbi:type III-B CRISPR-associated protein Cas10/Cmr2 [Candidatus Bathyarchaeota archaeon]|nr:type III-B CRISPR-associated protein Cas10/Cmr2 [Candidatus Bathyarchaeota archaeon]
MTGHAIAITIGSVQSLVAAARRTKDLWFGSHLISEMSKAMAKVVAGSGRLVFPAVDDSTLNNLDPAPRDTSAFNVSNIILAILEDGIDPVILKDEAIKAAKSILDYYANKLNETWIDQDIWNSQVSDLVSFHAAWVPFGGEQTWDKTRKRLMRLLSARKALRDFKPAKGKTNVPKCSLCGARESVLSTNEDTRARLRADPAFRLREGEEICALGLIKRNVKVSFPSVSRIAMQAWVKANFNENNKTGKFLQDLNNLLQENHPSFAPGTGDYYENLKFDLEFLYPSRMEQMIVEFESLQGKTDDLKILGEIKELMESARISEPTSYYAVILGDGDRMGKIISSIETPTDHRAFSLKLAEFTDKAKQIVNKNDGVVIYAGGDDVLALAPVHNAIEITKLLSQQFSNDLSGFKGNGEMTFSAGIVIAHVLEPLNVVLDWARKAERDAKEPDRNGLAIHLYSRSGSPLQCKFKWTEFLLDGTKGDIISHLVHLIKDAALPSGIPYALQDVVNFYQKIIENGDNIDILKKDVLKILSRKGIKPGKKEEIEDFILNLLQLDGRKMKRSLNGVKAMLVARHVAQVVETSTEE